MRVYVIKWAYIL